MKDQQVQSRRQYGDIEEAINELETRFRQFKNFDIVPYPPYDHHFYKPTKFFNTERENRVIQKEWETLEANLPNSIFVRAYESRTDLMRAVVVGLEGTPYSHGLFFFDILFPSNYPAKPPKLMYHSYDLDLNPSLQRNGNVNLNLLKTWWYTCYGHEEQRWNPKKSNILQVLVSIQSLILNSKPCLYEPKGVVMQTCKAMLYMLRNPPTNFEVFVAGYLRTKAHPILLNYKAQMDDTKTMNKLFFNLVKAFEDNGTYCKHHYNEQEKEQALKEEESLEENSEALGFCVVEWIAFSTGCGRPKLKLW